MRSRGSRDRGHAPADRRAGRDRGDRAARLPDAVVARDVHRRAHEAERPLLRRLRRRRPDRVPDRLALSRRLARHEPRGRPGSLAQGHRAHAARAALRGHRARPRARHHARGAGLERRCDPPLPLARLPADGHPARLLHGQPRGRADHVAGSAGRPRRPDDPRDRDVVRRHLRGGRRPATASVRSSIRSSQADLHARFGGVVPEIASRRHLELVVPVIEAALAEAGATLDDVDAIAVTQGPGPDRRAARRRLGRQGARVRARPAAASRSTTCSATSPRCGSQPLRARAAVRLPAGLGRPHARARRRRLRGARAPRRHARRRRRRGVRQGRAPARPQRGRAARRSSSSRATAMRSASRSRSCCAGRAVTTSRSRVSRPRSCAACASSATASPTPAPTWRRASRRRSCASWSSARRACSRPPADRRSRVVGGVAANGALRQALGEAVRAARRAPLPAAARAVRRQRGDDRRRGARRDRRSQPARIPRARRLRAQPTGGVGRVDARSCTLDGS